MTQEIDRLNERMMPFARELGVTFTAATKDKVTAQVRVEARLCTTPAVMHGGAIMAVADTLGGAGTILNLPDGKWTTTIESKTNFVAPAPVNTTITAECVPLHRGRRTMIWQTRITSEAGKLIAVVTQTQMVLDS